MKFGAQLYSLRKFIRTPSDVDDTFAKIAAMGYECVQFSGAEFDPGALAETIAKYDLPVLLTHISPQKLESDLNHVIAAHRTIGCDAVGLGSMPPEYRSGVEAADAFIKIYEPIAARLADNGLAFFYHNHDFEFTRLENGAILYDYLIDNAPHFNFTLDTYWVQRGGASVLEYIKKLDGKISRVHLKDMQTIPNEGQKYAPLGVGVINWQDVIAAFRASHAEYAFVEQDDAVDYPDPFGQLAISADYLIREGYLQCRK